MELTEHIHDLVGKIVGDRAMILERLLLATIQGEQLTLIQQDTSDPKTVKYEYRFEPGRLPGPFYEYGQVAFVEFLVGRLSAMPEFSSMHPEEVMSLMHEEYQESMNPMQHGCKVDVVNWDGVT